MENQTYGPDVFCPDYDDYIGTHRPGNDGPFFCIVCGSTTHTALVSTSK